MSNLTASELNFGFSANSASSNPPNISSQQSQEQEENSHIKEGEIEREQSQSHNHHSSPLTAGQIANLVLSGHIDKNAYFLVPAYRGQDLRPLTLPNFKGTQLAGKISKNPVGIPVINYQYEEELTTDLGLQQDCKVILLLTD